jgi:hypothetical protein
MFGVVPVQTGTHDKGAAGVPAPPQLQAHAAAILGEVQVTVPVDGLPLVEACAHVALPA